MAKKCMSCGGSMKKYQAGGAKKATGQQGMGYKKLEDGSNKNPIADKLKKKMPSSEEMRKALQKGTEKYVYPSKPEDGSTYKPKMKKGGFPDLTGDGKVTRADILKGRGVIKKKGGPVRMKK
jgi:hypothetical protein